jgi:ATP-dependent Clp protease ATP-binding subunit ClpA
MNRLFAPEFRNRLDAVVAFGKLGPAVMSRIVDKFIVELAAQLAERSVSIELSEPAGSWLAQKGYDPLYGARPLARVIQETIKRPLAEELLFGRLKDGGHVVITRGDPLDFAFGPAPDRRCGSRTARPKDRALAC